MIYDTVGQYAGAFVRSIADSIFECGKDGLYARF